MDLERPIFDVWPALSRNVPWEAVGELPTRVDPLDAVMRGADLEVEAWIKRDDLTSQIYGGNKVRTLEVLFGEARALDSTHVYSTGAFGSNHAAATVLHAPRVGLAPGVALFPQPPSQTAFENLRAMIGQRPCLRPLFHWSSLPFGMMRTRAEHRRRGERAYVMVPGGATPRGALGYVSAAFELARQVEAGELPAPRTIVIGVGSTCTSAGLLVGLHHAARLGIGFRDAPDLVSVRVTPWPVTSPVRIVRLAVRVARLLAELVGDPSLEVGYRTLRARLAVDGRELGWGYGRPTPRGHDAIERFRALDGLELDTTYSAKAAAGLLRRAREGAAGPLLFWSTKSTVPLPEASEAALADAPSAMRRWLARTPLR